MIQINSFCRSFLVTDWEITCKRSSIVGRSGLIEGGGVEVSCYDNWMVVTD